MECVLLRREQTSLENKTQRNTNIMIEFGEDGALPCLGHPWPSTICLPPARPTFPALPTPPPMHPTLAHECLKASRTNASKPRKRMPAGRVTGPGRRNTLPTTLLLDSHLLQCMLPLIYLGGGVFRGWRGVLVGAGD